MITFDSIREDLVTFTAASGLTAGKPCKISANGTVSACSEDDAFCGVAKQVRGGLAGVQMHGYVELAYTGTTAPTVGWCGLSADGAGGVQKDADGRAYLVAKVDTTAGTVGLFL